MNNLNDGAQGAQAVGSSALVSPNDGLFRSTTTGLPLTTCAVGTSAKRPYDVSLAIWKDGVCVMPIVWFSRRDAVNICASVLGVLPSGWHIDYDAVPDRVVTPVGRWNFFRRILKFKNRLRYFLLG